MQGLLSKYACEQFDPFTADPVKALHFAILVYPPFLIFDIRALWRSGLSARVPECQKLKMVAKTSMALNPSNSSNLEQLALKGLTFHLTHHRSLRDESFEAIKYTGSNRLVDSIIHCDLKHAAVQ